MKVYLVYQGEYSDRCVVGAFLDEQKAEKYAELKEKLDPIWGGAYVSEQEILDDKTDLITPVNKFYCYSISLEDNQDVFDNDDEQEYYQCDRECFFEVGAFTINAYSQRSLDHAKKIAEEQYQIYTQNKLVKEGNL